MTLHILLDLDHTLYPPSTGLMDEMHRRMERFLVEFLRVSPEEAERIRCGFRDRHGSTLRGLYVEHGAEPDRFLHFVHDGLPGNFLVPDPILQRALSALPAPAHIFTNAPEAYARRALIALGVEKHVDKVFDIALTSYVGKPDPTAYRTVEAALGIRASDCLLVDDTLSNVRGALQAGWKALWLTDGGGVAGVDSLRSISDLPGALGEGIALSPGGR